MLEHDFFSFFKFFIWEIQQNFPKNSELVEFTIGKQNFNCLVKQMTICWKKKNTDCNVFMSNHNTLTHDPWRIIDPSTHMHQLLIVQFAVTYEDLNGGRGTKSTLVTLILLHQRHELVSLQCNFDFTFTVEQYNPTNQPKHPYQQPTLKGLQKEQPLHKLDGGFNIH